MLDVCSAHFVQCTKLLARVEPPACGRPPVTVSVTRKKETATWRRDGVGLAGVRPRGPRLPQRVAEHGGEVVAEGGLVPPRCQPLSLQGLQRRAERQDGRARQRPCRFVLWIYIADLQMESYGVGNVSKCMKCPFLHLVSHAKVICIMLYTSAIAVTLPT